MYLSVLSIHINMLRIWYSNFQRNVNQFHVAVFTKRNILRSTWMCEHGLLLTDVIISYVLQKAWCKLKSRSVNTELFHSFWWHSKECTWKPSYAVQYRGGSRKL
jgi:hypothetical protein